MSGSGKAVPSKEFVDLEQNMLNADSFVNSTDLEFTNRESPNGNTKTKTIAGLVNDVNVAIENTIGKSYIGVWTVGITTFNFMNEYAEFNGVTYKPKSGITLPYVAQTSSPLTPPDSDNVEPFSDVNSSNISEYTDLTFDDIPSMISDAKIGDSCLVGATQYKRNTDNLGTIDDFENLTEIEPVNVRQDKTLELNKNYLNNTNPTNSVTNSVLANHFTRYVPKLIILLGQSNAEGRGTASDANSNNDTTGTRPSVQIWNNSQFEDLYIPRNTGETGNNDALPGRYGIELGIANFSEYNNDTTYMVKVTEGGTYMGQWLATEDIIPVGGGNPNDPDNDGDLPNANPPGGVLDSDAWTKVQAASAQMDVMFGTNGWEPVLVMLQGEANGTSATQKPRFKRQRKTFNERWRTRFDPRLRIIYSHILAVDIDYADVNGFMDEIDYEDQRVYVIKNTEHLQSYDNIHLNYFGLCQMSKRVYDEVKTPTSKVIAYPNGYIETLQATSTLVINPFSDVLIIEGTTTIDQTLPKLECRDGRILTLWRRDAGPGVTIRNNFGDPNVYANFIFDSGQNEALQANQRRRFIGYEGHWQEFD